MWSLERLRELGAGKEQEAQTAWVSRAFRIARAELRSESARMLTTFNLSNLNISSSNQIQPSIHSLRPVRLSGPHIT